MESMSSDECEAERGEGELLPETSKKKYKKAYQDFVEWRASAGSEGVTEKIIVAYFDTLSEKMKPTSMWAYYSMLRATIKMEEKVDIGTFKAITGSLKIKSSGYVPTKAEIFTKEQIDAFIFNAPDHEWLDVKVVCIFGIFGAMRSDELARITTKDVEQHGDLFLVQILEPRTKHQRSFTITGTYYDVVKRYTALRSPRMDDQRFFVNYRAGKCTLQVLGKRKFHKMAEQIATFLKLPNPQRYTGHSFKRSSASILENQED